MNVVSSIFSLTGIIIIIVQLSIYPSEISPLMVSITMDQSQCFFRNRRAYTMVSPGCPGTHSVDQADLKLRNLPASASQVLGLKVCTTTA
jgi:hypothetical protein